MKIRFKREQWYGYGYPPKLVISVGFSERITYKTGAYIGFEIRIQIGKNHFIIQVFNLHTLCGYCDPG